MWVVIAGRQGETSSMDGKRDIGVQKATREMGRDERKKQRVQRERTDSLTFPEEGRKNNVKYTHTRQVSKQSGGMDECFFMQVAFVHGRERTNKERVKHEEGLAKGGRMNDRTKSPCQLSE